MGPAPVMDPVIELTQVTQTFVSSDSKPVTALLAVELGLRRHEFVFIIGPHRGDDAHARGGGPR